MNILLSILKIPKLFSDSIKTKLHLQKVAGYSLSGAGPPYMVAGYVPGAKVSTVCQS